MDRCSGWVLAFVRISTVLIQDSVLLQKSVLDAQESGLSEMLQTPKNNSSPSLRPLKSVPVRPTEFVKR